jgi:hypothetical protein
MPRGSDFARLLERSDGQVFNLIQEPVRRCNGVGSLERTIGRNVHPHDPLELFANDHHLASQRRLRPAEAGALFAVPFGDDGLLRVVYDYPDVSGLEDWLVTIQSAILDFKPHRVALDSLSALEHVGSPKGVPRIGHRAHVVTRRQPRRRRAGNAEPEWKLPGRPSSEGCRLRSPLARPLP